MGDQPRAIEELTTSVQAGQDHQVLLGVTGSGKTFTMANVIQNTQLPTLIIAHNKTLAAQLYQEFRDFFPDNAVSYFVSYYDYYQPEAYIPSTDTYIEKEATINDEIDKLRLATTANLLTRKDCIVVASVSCIYNLGSPVEYGRNILTLMEGELIDREVLLQRLSALQYERSTAELSRGTYRIRGDAIQIWPAYQDQGLRIDTLENQIQTINWIDPISGTAIPSPARQLTTEDANTTVASRSKKVTLYPAKHYVVDINSQADALEKIKFDLDKRVAFLQEVGKPLEAHRLQQKVNYDLQMLKEFGFTNGIENYSIYFDGRQIGDPPYSLLEYFQSNAQEFAGGKYLTIVDESHITLPQIRGMYAGDRARKTTLIDYGFRLPTALDNRPLQYHEFLEKSEQILHVSATPNNEEISYAGNKVVEQLIRPTGLVDPNIELRPTVEQIEDLIAEIIIRKNKGQRTLVTTLTKKMAEALTEYLNDEKKIDQLVNHLQQKDDFETEYPDAEKTFWQQEELPIDDMEIGPIDRKYYHHLQLQQGLKPENTRNVYPKVAYLHSDIETLERSDILDDLRRGVYDVVIGINLLREGLDLPEVTLVAILDADKEGFLRSRTSLIQTMGRAARHSEGHVILYADKLTGSMKVAIGETLRRRNTQIAHNLAQGITPLTISKPFRDRMIEKSEDDENALYRKTGGKSPVNEKKKKLKEPLVIQLSKREAVDLHAVDPSAYTPHDKKVLAQKLNRRMKQAANDMDFELAAIIRDTIEKLN